jgi:hypothetical protein
MLGNKETKLGAQIVAWGAPTEGPWRRVFMEYERATAQEE